MVSNGTESVCSMLCHKCVWVCVFVVWRRRGSAQRAHCCRLAPLKFKTSILWSLSPTLPSPFLALAYHLPANAVATMANLVENKQMEFSGLEVEGIEFPPSVAALGSAKQLVLGGAGFRGLEINGNLIKFTAIGIYVDDAIIPHLSPKLRGKSVEELCENELLFEEVLSAPFEKLVRVVFLLPLSGPQYSEKVVERIGLLPNPGMKEESTKQFLEIFKPENFPPRTSLVCSFTEEALKIAFMKGNDFPKEADAVIEDECFARAFLASIIGKDGVSPLAKLSFAERLSRCL